MDYLRIGQKDGSNRTSGWKSAAHVNSILLTVTTISLFAGLVASTRQTHGLAKALLFYDGTCDGGTAAQLNVALHLLLNIISTAVFASSNFFMQVLNSPSRKEVDKIHARGSWLGIGVPSVRNAFRVGKFKTSCWLLLLVSSIPLHLLFNSMIFQTEQRDSDYQLTIASEGFVNGERFFAPGASLTPPGWLSGWGNDFTAYNYTNITQFSDTTSTAHRNISAIAEKGAQWNKISATDCHNEYLAVSIFLISSAGRFRAQVFSRFAQLRGGVVFQVLGIIQFGPREILDAEANHIEKLLTFIPKVQRAQIPPKRNRCCRKRRRMDSRRSMAPTAKPDCRVGSGRTTRRDKPLVVVWSMQGNFNPSLEGNCAGLYNWVGTAG